MKKNKKTKKKKKHKRHYYYDYPVIKKGFTEPIFYTELNDEDKKEVRERIYELISEFICYRAFTPDNDDMKEILKQVCEEISQGLEPMYLEPEKKTEEEADITNESNDDFDDDEEPEEIERELIPDDVMRSLFSELLEQNIQECREDGFDPPTYLDTLIVAETDRLKIRKFGTNDVTALWEVIKKPGVMPSWEYGLRKREAKKWINQQFSRYEKDGYGYYAVTLKESGKLIGQAGLFKSNVKGEKSVEIGYIFDNSVLGQEYCIEAAKACVEMAFSRLELDTLYCTVRSGNEPSIKIAKDLEMKEVGEYIKVLDEKEISYLIYALSNCSQ